MESLKFKTGDKVKVSLCQGTFTGKIRAVFSNYGQLTGEDHYLVKGDKTEPFETITPARALKLTNE